MVTGNKTSIGLLALGCLLLLAAGTSSIGQNRSKGSLYVIPTAGRCSETALPLELDGITLPAYVELRIKRGDEDKVVVTQRLTLENGVYKWSGLLVPLGKYKAQLYDGIDKAELLGEFTFNNIDILKDFITKSSGEIVTITRGEGETESGSQGSDAARGSLTLGNLPKPDGNNRLHIIVMNSKGNKADEFYGSPSSDGTWRSKPLIIGNYKLIVVEYSVNGNCQIIRGR